MAKAISAALRCAVTWCLIITLLAGCGGGGSGSDGPVDGPDKFSNLVVGIDFPLPYSSLRGAAEVAVSGTIQDDHDGTLDAGDIAAFVVNEITLVVDEATGRWSGVLPTAAGESPLQITAEVTDRNGVATATTVTVDNQPEQPGYTFLSLLPRGDSAVVWGSGSLRNVDLASGVEQAITDEVAGQLYETGTARKAIQVDERGQQVYVLDDCYIRDCSHVAVDAVSVQVEDASVREVGQLSAWRAGYISESEYRYFSARDGLFAYSGRSFNIAGSETNRCGLDLIDLETGSKSRLLDTSVWDAQFNANFCPGALVLDTRRNRVIVAYDEVQQNPVFPGLYAVDLSTGALSVTSGDDAGAGPGLDAPEFLFPTSSGESVITLGEQGVFTVELESGDRTLLLAEPDLPADITDADFDETHNRIVIASGGETISGLDLASGSLDSLLNFSNAVGTGPDLGANSPTVLDELNNRLLVLETGTDRLIEVDLSTLQRRVLVEELHSIAIWNTAVLNPEGTQLYYQDFFDDLYTVDLVTGEQRLLTGDTLGPSMGSGMDLGRASGMCLDSVQGLLYLVGDYTLAHPPFEPVFSSNGVLSVDTATGESRIVSAEEMSLDWADVELDAILCDLSNERLLIASEQAVILEVDPSSGQRHRLVERFDDGGGVYPRSFAWDTGSGRVLLHVYVPNDAGGEEIRSINLDTGEYEVAAKIPHTWVYDRSADLFYASREIGQGRGEYIARDRKTDSQVVIAYPE